MLYNKNNVRKTNDKKILHKVGKQWKVVSVALLMAIGGGAAVATHANAQSNNGVDASTANEVSELETPVSVQGPESVAPKSASVAPKSASASASSVAPVSYMNDHGGSAASYHAKVTSDKTDYKVNNTKVQAYVNSLNAQFPSATDGLLNASQSANAQLTNDQGKAQSYSNIAAKPNYSSEVSTLASKSGQTPSGFVQSVAYQASYFGQSESNASNTASQMNVINSYAQLLSNAVNNSALYSADYESVNANWNIAIAQRNAAEGVDVAVSNASSANDSVLRSAKHVSASNSMNEVIANIYAGLDADTTNSLASAFGYTDSSAVSSENHSNANSATRIFNNNDSLVAFNNVSYNYNTANSSFVSAYNKANKNSKLAWNQYNVASSNVEAQSYDASAVSNTSASASANAMFILLSDTAQEDQYNSLSASANSVIASAQARKGVLSAEVSSANSAFNSASNAVNSLASDEHKYSILANPNLDELFGTPTTKTTVNSEVASQVVDNATVGVPTQDLNVVKADINAFLANYQPKIMAKVNNDINAKRSEVQKGINKANSDISALKLEDSVKKNNNNATKITYLQNKVNAANAQLKNINATNLSAKANQTVKDLSGKLGYNLKNVTKKSEMLSTINDVLNSDATLNKYHLTPAANSKVANEVSAAVNNISVNAIKTIVKNVAKPGVVAVPTNTTTMTYGDTGLLNAASYADAAPTAKAVIDDANGNISAGASAINSLANSDNAAYSSASASSAQYSNATDENVTLASYYATSYSNDINGDKSAVSSADDALNNFYGDHNASYTTDSLAAASASAAINNDAALAQANGVYQFNHAPKYLTVVKNCGLYSNTDFTKKAHMMTVPAGTSRMKVLGVGFSVNGRTRYSVEYNGKKGYVTSYPTYVQGTYLPTQSNVDVTVTKPSKVYASVSKKGFGKVAAKTLPAGAQLSNVNIISADGIYGGFTAIETPSGKFVSANIAYASVNGNNSNDNNNTVTPSHNGVVSYWN